MFHGAAFFSCVFGKSFIKILSKFHETSPGLKNLWLSACSQALFLNAPFEMFHSILNTPLS